MSHKTAGGHSSGAHWMQFIAERGIEYGLQFVTQFFLNSPDCLYTKKSSEFLQSYEKTSEMQKENVIFFLFPSVSNFGEAKVTKSRQQNKGFHSFFAYNQIFIWKLHK